MPEEENLPTEDLPILQSQGSLSDIPLPDIPMGRDVKEEPEETPVDPFNLPLPQPPSEEAIPEAAFSQPLPTPPSVPQKPSFPSKPSLPTRAEAPRALPAKPPVNAPPVIAPPRPPGKVEKLTWPLDQTIYEHPDDSSNIIYEQKEDDSTKAKIKAASITKLIEKATAYSADANLQKTLLLTYRSMISPDEFLDLLKLRFSMPLPAGNDASVASFKDLSQRPIQVR